MVKPDELVHGMTVKAKFSRRDNEEGTGPDWGPELTVKLFVERRKDALKNHPAGELVAMAPEDMAWAMYVERDYDETYDEWLCEEYRMKIIEVLPSIIS
jgi:hypothetical protein